ncbi:MAG: hypothetical protein GXP55_09230 [Deltaproteobacteria bacterium]|nr:hypothetical protein [Deltaproteobacteria bacterium]
MSHPSTLWMLLLPLLLACGAGHAPEQASPTVASPLVATGGTNTTTEPSEVADVEPPAPADAPLDIRVRGELAEGGAVTAVVEVHGGTARLARTIGVEREVDGRFEPVGSVAGLELRADCQTPAPECVEIVVGAELRPPPWLGTLGDAQCICTRCAPAPAGTYRFVLTSCDGRQRVESPAFELASR